MDAVSPACADPGPAGSGPDLAVPVPAWPEANDLAALVPAWPTTIAAQLDFATLPAACGPDFPHADPGLVGSKGDHLCMQCR